jgi:hypothetical protein
VKRGRETSVRRARSKEEGKKRGRGKREEGNNKNAKKGK